MFRLEGFYFIRLLNNAGECCSEVASTGRAITTRLGKPPHIFVFSTIGL